MAESTKGGTILRRPRRRQRAPSRKVCSVSDLTYVMVYFRDQSCLRAEPSDEPVIESAVLRWLGRGEGRFAGEDERDSLITLNVLGGDTYKCLASMIYSWMHCTPEGRAANNEIDAALNAEKEPTPPPPRRSRRSSRLDAH
jgi:hypothetical protein